MRRHCDDSTMTDDDFIDDIEELEETERELRIAEMNREMGLAMTLAGVSLRCQRTTLPRIGAQALRERLEGFVMPEGGVVLRGMLLTPQTATQSHTVRRAAQVYTKEMLLFGTNAHCISLIRLADILETPDSDPQLYQRICEARAITILDFYLHGSAMPLPNSKAAVVYDYLFSLMDNDVCLNIHSDSGFGKMTDWWPRTLVYTMRHELEVVELLIEDGR